MSLFDAPSPDELPDERVPCTYFDDGRTCLHPGCVAVAGTRAAPSARRTDPGTSHEAARSLDAARLKDVHRRIVELLDAHAETGLTDEQMAAAWAQRGWPAVSPSGLRTRRAELVAAGRVVDSGRFRTTASGRRTIVWALDPSCDL